MANTVIEARRGYRRAADVSSCCTLADGVVRQMICCTENGRFLTALESGGEEHPAA
jgi:hypothetical protein